MLWDSDTSAYAEYATWTAESDGTSVVTSDGYYLDMSSYYSEGTWTLITYLSGSYNIYGGQVEGSAVDLAGLITDCAVSSKVFEANEDGTYSVANPAVVIDVDYFCTQYYGTADTLDVAIGTDSITFTVDAGTEAYLEVSYTNIGSTTVSETAATLSWTYYTLRSYWSMLTSYGYSSYIYSSCLTSDETLLQTAARYIMLPEYGFDGFGLFNNSTRGYLSTLEADYLFAVCYEYFSESYYYFEQALQTYMGFSVSTVTDSDSTYRVLSKEFTYSYTQTVTDEEGNPVDSDGDGVADTETVEETHTCDLIRLGAYYTDSTYTNVDVEYVWTVDYTLDTSSEETAAL